MSSYIKNKYTCKLIVTAVSQEMKFEVVSLFILLTEIIFVCGRQRKFVIENKKTGNVIEVSGSGHEVLAWDNTDMQLWTLESRRNGYKIRNVANEDYIIRCDIDNTAYTKWKLSTEGDTRIEVEDPNIYLCEDETSLICCTSKNYDESDVWKFIEQSKKINMTFAIENKKTGEVLEERDTTLEMGRWKNRNSQLWTLKPQKHKSEYSIVNVASGRVLAYSKNDENQDAWKFNTREDTWIHNEDTRVFLVLKNGKPVFNTYIQNDDSEKWLFVERESLKQIYVENYEERFVIENKKTGMVMERTEDGYKVTEWSNRDSQLYTLESEDASGYIIRNIAKRYILCEINDIEYNVWQFNVQNETRIEIKDPKIIRYLSIKDNNDTLCARYKRDDDSDIWILIEQSKKNNMKFVIENKNTGNILEAIEGSLIMGNWENRDSQLWTLKSQNVSGYSIVNVADGKILTYFKNGTDYEVLKLSPREDTRIEVAHLNVFLTNKNGKPVFLGYKQNDDSDKWRFIQQEYAENTQPKQIYVEDYQEKFVIENKKTKKVLGILQRYIVLEEWKDKDLQLWTLEPQNKSDYFIIRNIEDRGVLTYNKNGTDCQTWKINTQGETWIQLEDANVFLADRDGAVTFVENKQVDDSDIWLLVDQTSKRANMKFKPIYIEPQLYDIEPS